MKTNLLIDGNNYEFNKNSRNGVYIIHGFTNSTYENKELAEFLGTQGFYTKTNNLPGHGTTPEEYNRYNYKDWIEFVEKDVAEMSTKCDKISVIGIGMKTQAGVAQKMFDVLAEKNMTLITLIIQLILF